MKATPLCAAEMKWNSDNVLELVDVVDELTGTPAAITSADSVTVEIFDADGDTEHSVSPVTLNQVGSTNAWRNTVLANAANEFAIGQRIRLVFKFDGGAGIVGEFEALSVVVTAKS